MTVIVVLHEIRKISNIPVIMLTALDDEYTQSNSFDEMADDYITKPFSMLILGKRITALLRRSQNKPAVNTVKLGDITVDFSGYTASNENGKIDITPKELEILKVLIDNIRVAGDGFPRILVQFLDLRHVLDNGAARNISGTHGCQFPRQTGQVDRRSLVQNKVDMTRQRAMVDLVGAVVQRLKYLGIQQADEEIEGRVIIRDYGIEGAFFLA